MYEFDKVDHTVKRQYLRPPLNKFLQACNWCFGLSSLITGIVNPDDQAVVDAMTGTPLSVNHLTVTA